MRPQGTTTFSIDRKCNVPLTDIRFDGWYESSAHLWPKHSEQKEHFLLLERTALQTPSIISLSDSGVDTLLVFKKMARNNLPVHPRETSHCCATNP